jgi:hypothetical protein
MLDQITLDQMQTALVPMHDVSALLTHPDFQRGVTDAQKQFVSYEPASLSEDEMITLVEETLSCGAVEKDKEACGASFSYFYNLGWVFGMINEGSPSACTTADSPHTLSALLEHSDFLRGIDDAQKGFLFDYEAAPLTEDQMMTLVDEDLSYRAIEQNQEMFADTDICLPYFWCLGFVFGIINEGLTYTYTIG